MRDITLLSIAVLLGFTEAVHSQPGMLWFQTYGGGNSDYCNSLIPTPGGGYALAGYTASFGDAFGDMYLVIANAEGEVTSTHAYGGDTSDVCNAVILNHDGGYALAGATRSFGTGDYNLMLAVTDDNGDSLWARTYGGEGDDYCYTLLQADDGGYLLAGYTTSFGAGEDDMWLLKVDSGGDSIWSKTYGGRNWEACYALMTTADGGYALAGGSYTFGPGNFDYWLVKTNADGDSLWAKAYGGADYDFCLSAVQTDDGGYALGGYTASFDVGLSDMWVVRTDENGDSLWAQSYGGGSYDRCFEVINAEGGGLVLAGYTGTYGAGVFDMWLIRTDDAGEVLWSQTYGGGSSDWCNCVIATPDGGYALAGFTYSYGAGDNDFFLVKTDSDPEVIPDFTLHPSSFTLSVYPNPFNQSVQIQYSLPEAAEIKLMVYNLSGREVVTLLDGRQPAGSHQTAWDSRGTASGTYVIRLESAEAVRTKKLALVK